MPVTLKMGILIFILVIFALWPGRMSLDSSYTAYAIEVTQMDQIQTTGVSPEPRKYVRRNTKQRNHIVIIGASFAQGWNPGGIAGLIVVNKGVGGERSFEIHSRFEKDVISLNPKAVIIWGFINDIFGTRREEIKTSLAKIRENYKEMIRLAQDNGIIPILATEVTIRGPDRWSETLAGWVGRIFGKESYQDYVNKHVLAMNQWLREHAKTNDLLLIDLQPLLSDERGIREKEYATQDGAHISKHGYEKITTYTREILETYLKKL